MWTNIQRLQYVCIVEWGLIHILQFYSVTPLPSTDYLPDCKIAYSAVAAQQPCSAKMIAYSIIQTTIAWSRHKSPPHISDHHTQEMRICGGGSDPFLNSQVYGKDEAATFHAKRICEVQIHIIKYRHASLSSCRTVLPFQSRDETHNRAECGDSMSGLHTIRI